MINDKEFLKFEDGFFKPYFEKFIEFKRGKGEKVASSTLIRFRKLNNSLNQYQTDQISEKMIRELLTPHNGLSEIERQYMASNLRQFCSFLVLLGVNAAAVPPKYMKITRCEFRPYIFSDEELHRLVVVADSLSPSYRTKSHQQIYPVLVRMLIGTGMRIGETYTLKQVKVLLKEAKGTKIYMYMIFMLLMGLRKSEVSGLKYSDVDYVNHTLTIERQLGRDLDADKEDVPIGMVTKQEIDVKTESSKRIEPIPDFVFYEIQEERKRYEKNRSRRQHGIWVFQDLDYICCSSYGRPRSISFIYKPYKELIEKIGLPYICPHDLRHTYTTLLMKNNINQRAIAASLGHTQFETYTDEHRKEYVIADNSLNEDIYERGIETNVGDLMYGATKEAKGLLDLAEAEETFAQAGEKCVQNAIITTVQYIYKFGCEVGIY